MKKTLVIIIPSLFIILVASIFLIIRPSDLPNTNTSNLPIPTSNKIIIPTRSEVVIGTQDQGQADKNFAEELTRQRNPYPWYSKLPLITSNYFIYFDLEKKIFIGKIYAKKNSLKDDQIAEIKRGSLIRLSELGIEINNFRIEWYLL